jgi:hypothetical protein
MNQHPSRIRSLGPWFVWDRHPSYTLEVVLTLCTSRHATEILRVRLGVGRLRFGWYIEREWAEAKP